MRTELLAEVKANYNWYKENLPRVCNSLFTIEKFMKILQNSALTAPRSLWYPLPGGCSIISNTYKRPVISYSAQLVCCSTTLPFLSPPQPDVKPIVLAVIHQCHCISLDLDFSHTLPIPYIHPEWHSLRSTVAEGWDLSLSDNIEAYRLWRRTFRTKAGPGSVTVNVDWDD